MNFTSLSACTTNQTSQLHTSTETGSPHPLVTTETCLPQTLLYSFCSQVQPPSAPAWHVVSFCPRMWIYMWGYMCLKNCCYLSIVGYHVFDHFILFRVVSPSLINKVNRIQPGEKGLWKGFPNYNSSITHLADIILSFWLKRNNSLWDARHTAYSKDSISYFRAMKMENLPSSLLSDSKKEKKKMGLTENIF